MQSPEFAENPVALTELARSDRVVLMCAEAVPWRCHRSLLADALIVHGVPTCEIISQKTPAVPKMTSFAQVSGLAITYPPEADG